MDLEKTYWYSSYNERIFVFLWQIRFCPTLIFLTTRLLIRLQLVVKVIEVVHQKKKYHQPTLCHADFFYKLIRDEMFLGVKGWGCQLRAQVKYWCPNNNEQTISQKISSQDERCRQPLAHPTEQACTSMLSQDKCCLSQQQTNKPQVAFTRQVLGVPIGILNHHYTTVQTNRQTNQFGIICVKRCC